MMTDTETGGKVDSEPEPETAAAAAPPAAMAANDDGEQVDIDMSIGQFQLQIQRKQMPLVGFFVASMIFMIASIAQRDNMKWYAYSLSVGVVGMFLAVVGLVLLKFASEIPHKYLAWLSLLWAFLGALLLTFGDSPFAETGNGYFSLWAMVLFAAQHAGVSQEDVRKEISGASSLNLLGIMSIVVIVATSFEFPNPSEKGNTVYLLTLACLTVCLVAVILFMERGATKSLPAMVQFVVLAIFSIMWIVAAALATFDGPFQVTGNGYFASWGGAIISIFAALSARQQMKASQ